MSEQTENAKEKYSKIFQEFRLAKNESNLLKVYNNLVENKNNLLDNDIIPFQFTNDLIWLLFNNILDIKIQTDIFKLYIDSFFTFKTKNENIQKLTFLDQIFKYDSFLYKNLAETDDFNCFIKKYFDKFYPKKNKIKIEPGEIVDVFISEKDLVGDLIYGWVQLPIKRIENNYVIFNDYDDENKELRFLIDSYEIQEKNTFVTSEEMNWRDKLQRGDKVDILNNKRVWVEGNLLNVLSKNAVISSLGSAQGDHSIRNIYSPLFRPPSTFCFQYEEFEKKCFNHLLYNCDYSKFNYCLPVPKVVEGESTNFLLPNSYLSYHTLLFYDIFNYFINKLVGGKVFENLPDETLSIEYIYKILDILSKGFEILNQLFFGKYFKDVMFPRIKNILLNVSKDKKKNISKIMITRILDLSVKFLKLACYDFQLPKLFLEFILNFGFNCFKENENLEKRLIGLNSILLGLSTIDMFNRNRIDNEYNLLVIKLFLCDDENDLIELLFNKSNIHEQLVLKGTEIIASLYSQNLLDTKDINKLYNYAISSQEGTDICTQLYTLLKNMSRDMSLHQSQILINKIITFPLDQIRQDDVSLIISIIQNIQNENNYKNTVNVACDFIYSFITYDIIKGKNYLSEFTRTIGSLKDGNDIFFSSHFIEKIINELLKKKTLRETEVFYDFLSYFIMAFTNDNREIMKSKMRDYLTWNNNSQQLLDNLVGSIEDNTEDISMERKIDHLNAIFDSIKSILFFTGISNFFTTDSIMKFCDIFLFSKKKQYKQNEFMNSLLFFKRNNCMNIYEFGEKFFAKLDQFISEINKDNYMLYSDILDEDYVEMALKFYQTINNLEEAYESDDAFINENCYVKKNPLELQYFEIVWKLFTKTSHHKLMEEFFSIFSLRLFSPEERHEIWKYIIKKIFDEEDNFIYPKMVLQMTINIIIESEKFGTAGTIYHSLENIKKIPLKLSIKSKIETIHDFDLNENIYTSSTLYEVKKEIQKKTSIDPVLIDFCNLNSDENNRDSNGKNLCTVFHLLNNSTSSLTSLTKEQQEKTYVLTMIKSSDCNRMKKYNLVDYKNPNSFDQKTLDIFKKIFNESTNGTGKMDKKVFIEYYKKATGNQNINNKIYDDIKRIDHENKGYWNFDNFAEYYWNAYREGRIYPIFYNLHAFGYRNDLELINTPFDKMSPLYYEENNVMEYMPRYFIGNNMEYMNKLFTFSLSEDKSVHELALKIINELCTMTQMKNLLFGEKSENEKLIDDLLEKDNLEMRSYAFNLILSELEKNNETNNKDIQLAIHNFIENNITKIIDHFDDYINNFKEIAKNDKKFINKENTQFIQFLNYYHVNIQIILFAIKKAIDNPSIFELLQKFDDNMDNKESIILNTVSNIKLSETNLKLLNKINLEKLFNIIISYFLFLKEQIKTVLYDLKFSFKILIIIFILLDQNLDNNKNIKENIYNNYIENIVNLSQTPVTTLKRFFRSANEIILFLKKTDKKFADQIKEKTSKEIIKYQVLNTIFTKNYLFVVFKDIINILMKKELVSIDDKSLTSLFNSIIDIISNKDLLLKEYLITSYLEILTLVIKQLRYIDFKFLEEYDFSNLLIILINNYIIKSNTNNTYSKNNDIEYISKIFELIYEIIIVDPDKYILKFFNNEEIKNVKIKHLSTLADDKVNYDPKYESKNSTGYLGLKNLSSLCYMNSVIQQLFMIPIFKKSILNIKINDTEFKLHEKEDVDDLLFQLIKMFYYLRFSDKSYYNPKSFVYSFKDYDGNPTNPNVQCDAQEFLTRFIEKVEEKISNTSERFLCNNILGGTTLQQIICTNIDCKNVSERRESIVYLSLDLKGNYTLDECLDKFIGEEKIEDYHCEKCDKKITHIKKVLIDKLPNILILHLQRIAFNYETFLMEKINDEISFDTSLNIKKYTVDRNNKNEDREKYEYELIGIIVHSGTAQYGHYYSVIFSQDRKYENKWFKFNDISVNETLYETIQRDFGCNSDNKEYNRSPYMLLYRKKIKNPVLVNIREIKDNENILNLLKDDKNTTIIDNGVNYEVYKDEKEAIETNKNNEKNDKEIILKDNKLIGHLISYDEAIKYMNTISENIKDENIPFKSMILEENIKFCNDKKIYSNTFLYFIDTVIFEMNLSCVKKDDSFEEKYMPVIKLINDYLFNIFALSWSKDKLKSLVEHLIDIYKFMPNMISYLVKDIFEPKKEILLKDYLLCKDSKLGEAFSFYLAEILISSIENNIEAEISFNIIKYYLQKIPVEISKKWMEMEFYNTFILILIENSEIIKKKLLAEETISLLIDFILGKGSPLYKGDDRNENKNIKGKLGPLVRSVAFLYQYYIDNKEKDTTLKLSENDEKMINYIPFYENIIVEDYDEEGSSILIKLKFDSSLNVDGPLSKENLDLIVKIKIPSCKGINSIISCISLIGKIFESYKDENNKIKLLNEILGIPTIFCDSGEIKICYVSGAYYNYYSILNNIANKKEANEEMIPLFLSIFELFNKHEDIYEYICKLPAPNSYSYKYNEYLLKLYLETIETIEKNNDIKYDKQIYQKLIEVMDVFCKKYNIILENIKNDISICIRNHIFPHALKYDRIDKINNLNNEFRQKIENYEDKIKMFYMKMDYYSTIDSHKTNFDLFINKSDITYHNCSHTTGELSKLKLQSHRIEGVFVLGVKDCNLSFSLEPYINSKMEISIKKYEKYFLFIKELNLINDTNNKNKDEVVIGFDIYKLQIEDIQKNHDEISEYPDSHKLQVNEDALVINCNVCGVANVIDENNQTFQCIFCSASLL